MTDATFPIDRGGPLDGDACDAANRVCAFPVDAYPVQERILERVDPEDGELEVELPQHADNLWHLYARCVACSAFHYLGIFTAHPREGRLPLYIRAP